MNYTCWSPTRHKFVQYFDFTGRQMLVIVLGSAFFGGVMGFLLKGAI